MKFKYGYNWMVRQRLQIVRNCEKNYIILWINYFMIMVYKENKFLLVKILYLKLSQILFILLLNITNK